MHHVNLGYLVENPGVNYYYYITSESGAKTLMCIRGTSQLEGFHKHLRNIIPGFHSSPRLITCLLAVYVYRWNMDRAVEHGFIPKRYGGWYEHNIVLEMQELAKGMSWD